MKIFSKWIFALLLSSNVATNIIRPQAAEAQADPQTVLAYIKSLDPRTYIEFQFTTGNPISILYIYASASTTAPLVLLQKFYIGANIGNFSQLLAWLEMLPPTGTGAAAGAGTVATICGTMSPALCFSLYGVLIAETTYLVYNLGAWYNACGEYTKAIQEYQKLTLKAATWECTRQLKPQLSTIGNLPTVVQALLNSCIDDYMERERQRVAGMGNCRSGYGDAFCRMYAERWGWNCDKAAPTPTPTPTRTPTKTPANPPPGVTPPIGPNPTPIPSATRPAPIPTVASPEITPDPYG